LDFNHRCHDDTAPIHDEFDLVGVYSYKGCQIFRVSGGIERIHLSFYLDGEFYRRIILLSWRGRGSSGRRRRPFGKQRRRTWNKDCGFCRNHGSQHWNQDCKRNGKRKRQKLKEWREFRSVCLPPCVYVNQWLSQKRRCFFLPGQTFERELIGTPALNHFFTGGTATCPLLTEAW